MANLKLQHVHKRYDDQHHIIKGVDLEIQDGEFVVFVGPSGCGKSTLLRMIAGLEEISSGELLIGERRANALSPAQRGVAMVFQSYALYPHKNVYDNMAFGLRMAGQSRSDIDKQVRRAAEILQISHLLERKPKDLSGGQRQRVAIGRAIVRKPEVFLFDEPLSNLDAALRVKMRIELSKLHQELGSTMIYVTHDQVEAMTLGDRIVVFNAGRVEQVGTPLELYNSPANKFVAGFLGAPGMNFIDCRLHCGTAGSELQFGAGHVLPLGKVPQGAIPQTLGIRPEDISVTTAGEGIAAVVDLVEHLGDSAVLYAELAGVEDVLAIKLNGAHGELRSGQKITLRFDVDKCHLFAEDGMAINWKQG